MCAEVGFVNPEISDSHCFFQLAYLIHDIPISKTAKVTNSMLESIEVCLHLTFTFTSRGVTNLPEQLTSTWQQLLSNVAVTVQIILPGEENVFICLMCSCSLPLPEARHFISKKEMTASFIYNQTAKRSINLHSERNCTETESKKLRRCGI